jgi:hypothetical protein
MAGRVSRAAAEMKGKLCAVLSRDEEARFHQQNGISSSRV